MSRVYVDWLLTGSCDYDGDEGTTISSFATLFRNIRVQCVTFAAQPVLCTCLIVHSLILSSSHPVLSHSVFIQQRCQ